jgi:hemolysin activation/secretion protein
MRQEAERAKRLAAQEAKLKSIEKDRAKLEERITEIALPEDTSRRMSVREARITGNMVVTTAELIEKMPLIYNASDRPLEQAESEQLYDFRVLMDVVLQPGPARQVTARTIQGFTQYILSVYQAKSYAGIYVYVPAEAYVEGALKDEVLPVKVLEAKVTDVTVRTYEPNQIETEEGYLNRELIEKWSPVKEGKVANQKELDDFVNLLNLNPDRYVSAVVSRGAEPETLAVAYNIYEANPWHWFIQVDNAGTRERQWNPRIGVINTNLFGMDDTFTAVYQAPWDSGIDENYGIYGSYDFPIFGPRLRLNLYGGHSEYDIDPETGIFNFIGRGSIYGGVLRYNLLQTGGWFFDIKGSVEHTRSKVTPSIFGPQLGSDVKFWLWGVGADLHRRDDITNSSLTFDWYRSWGGESNGEEFRLSRPGSTEDTMDSIFSLYTATATHSRYLDPNKVQRASATFRWTGSDERLVPAKMTAYGGMYTVRGYDEYEYIADGGILTSFQYEFDLVRHEQTQMRARGEKMEDETPPLLRKLAPVVFFDYGRGKVRHPASGERGHDELMSVGGGAIAELGDNFTGVVYYGYPLTATEFTREGKGRVSVGLLYRW